MLAQFISYAAFVSPWGGGVKYLSVFCIGHRVWLGLIGKVRVLATSFRSFFLNLNPEERNISGTNLSSRITGLLAIILLRENYGCCIASYRSHFHFQLAE
jgi:hypothetical protein